MVAGEDAVMAQVGIDGLEDSGSVDKREPHPFVGRIGAVPRHRDERDSQLWLSNSEEEWLMAT